MRIGLVAHGRFHAFDLAREFAKAGHSTTLVTNYPKFAVARWGVAPAAIKSLPLHTVASRLAARLGLGRTSTVERRLHEWFGRSAARAVQGQPWSALVCWSGVGEEIFRNPSVGGLRVCHRSSAHIRIQDQLLRDEGVRAGYPIERPSDWMIAREEREYELSDVVLVPSTFVLRSFITRGFPPQKVSVVPLGVDTAMFRPTRPVVEERCRRILAGEPLHVAYVGTLSLQKGLKDFIDVSRALAGRNFEFHATGPIAADAQPLLGQLSQSATHHPARPQRELPDTYRTSDIFMFPTIQDGFGMVISQALAAAMPVVCTTNCCGPDVISEGATGWVVPAQTPQAFIDRLQWCDDNRARLAEMVWASYERFVPRSWADTAADMAAEFENRSGTVRSTRPAAAVHEPGRMTAVS